MTIMLKTRYPVWLWIDLSTNWFQVVSGPFLSHYPRAALPDKAGQVYSGRGTRAPGSTAVLTQTLKPSGEGLVPRPRG